MHKREAQQAVHLSAMLALQRDVTERLLLTALRENDSAAEFRASGERAAFLAEAGLLLGRSLDESVTERAIAGLSLPAVADWCVVDLLDARRGMHRLAIVHRDPAIQQILDDMQGRWIPHKTDAFGIAVVLEDEVAVQVTGNVTSAIAASAHDPDVAQLLSKLPVGPLLTVPLAVNRKLLGAITFFGNTSTDAFTNTDIELATALATRCAIALEKARLYTETLVLKTRAEREAGATTAFLRSMSHELRTPLQAIAGNVEIMVRGIHGPVTNEQRVDLERIIGSQRHLLILINELIEYMRTGGSRGVFEPIPISVESAVKRAADVIGPLMHKKDITFVLHTNCARVMAMADENKLHQILINLIANAVKFTESGGQIEVYCDMLNNHVTVSVADTGRGIPQERFESIFEPFTQLQASDKDQLGGMGLGLSISRDLARAMNGDVTVASVVGQGSTFTIRLPAAGAAKA